MNGRYGEPIDLDKHFEELSADWEMAPLDPIWLPKKFLRNKEAHAFPYSSIIGMGTSAMYTALCGWEPDDKVKFRKSGISSPPNDFFNYAPENNLCSGCVESEKLYKQKMVSFKHVDEAAGVRVGYKTMKTKQN